MLCLGCCVVWGWCCWGCCWHRHVRWCCVGDICWGCYVGVGVCSRSATTSHTLHFFTDGLLFFPIMFIVSPKKLNPVFRSDTDLTIGWRVINLRPLNVPGGMVVHTLFSDPYIIDGHTRPGVCGMTRHVSYRYHIMPQTHGEWL